MSTRSVEPARPSLAARSLGAAVLRPGGLWSRLDVVPETGSTNADLVAGGGPDGAVLVAEAQLAGRGRLDRGWVSPPRAGLTFSVLLRPGAGVPVARWGWLPLLAGVALHAAVRDTSQVEAALKWPNDLLLGPSRRKGAGILAQVTGDAVVVGVGLNVSTRRSELPGPGATSLVLEGAADADRDALLRAVLHRLEAEYVRWRAAGGDPAASGLHAAYGAVCHTVGRQVRVLLPHGDQLVGTATAVDLDGRLVVRTSDGVYPVAAGDVVHLR
ncbi:MAG: biotin--[acetyl-CoA-carboxylase] ligase [Actinobacteria bacterium]|nr:biotin--[acetyl-CoA-carboxylase] ligase [Actinomycetota bacterium]MBI3687885.1 biotin--[acetyl-CoA-carboxylase] ligase [Actinomycetota bacterium]